ncbi:GNAT family N-acetyltransferase [Chitinophaga vietnamensis]|uniref:GNAT family N-acetyltransferase n=1 Tax=Chitinophaga vietnamensis TaxID=2593957 RepID=UPI00117770A2|nr:GNAT family N-acetyltransferase [Chitinophaga vietnamensis]
MKNYLFQSGRLGFRKWQDADLAPFAAITADPEVMEFFSSTLNLEETAQMLVWVKAHFDQHGYGLYAVDTLHDEQFIGFIGFNHPSFEADFTPCVEIGWRLRRSAWGQGYATEGARRCLQYARDVLHLPLIYSFTSMLNKRSEQVMIKLGMEKTGEFEHPRVPDGHRLKTHVLYRINTDKA